MVKIEQIKDFISSNFELATLSGRVVKDKIELRLHLNNEKLDYETISIYSEDLNKLRKDPERLIEYLFDYYINNNTIIRVEYFANIRHHENKVGFIIEGTMNTFQIALENNLIKILPKDFTSRLEQAKRQGIIKVLENTDINNFTLKNIDSKPYSMYKTGLTFYKIDNTLSVSYEALKLKNIKDEVFNPEFELKFIKILLRLIIEKEQVNLEELRYKYNHASIYYSIFYKYDLNNKTTFTTYTSEGLELYKSFLKEYNNTYQDEIESNQLKIENKKLILERKGE